MSLGLLGRKLGMTQLNDEQGRHAVTLVEVGPCLVLQKKTVEKDGYCAFKLAFGAKKEKRTDKATKGDFARVKATSRRFIREFRVKSEELGKFEEGQEITFSQVFKVGQIVDVAGKTKGHGFTGVVKRWGMKGNRRTHGTHEFFRHGGSIGTRTWPGNVHKGKKMCGHYGDERVTTQNLKIVRFLEEQNCMLISGNLPGATNSVVEIHPTVFGS
ncbi:MAG: 50S ribosomal protein L3 [Pseudomonadota bacterium]